MGLFDAKPSQASNVLPEVADCDRQLTALNQRREELIRQIGELYLENNDSTAAAGTPYEEFLKEIEKLAVETLTVEKRKLAVQGLRKCEECGNILVLDSSFCNKCGRKLEPLFVPTEDNPRICAKCGTAYAEGAVFCVGCGNKLE
ncbi:zinc ribbon domain-containing protein [bacterium D16-50]|nr:zinc ribbon domain-containing protein [Lachnospiraceae bacterium]RKJ18933.1 zinc ribbon domain-containing protein [bacterium D16-50]